MTDAMIPPPTHRRTQPTGWVVGAGLSLLIVIYVGVLAIAPMPTVSAHAIPLSIETPARAALAWPSEIQAAVGVLGSGVLATTGNQTSVPIASIAKLVLALELLAKQPLKIGETGSAITFTDADEQLYRDKIKDNQSVVPVATGEQFTQYEALQALLLPSGNNIADSLAIRAFGSVADYLTIANQQLKDWGLTQTHLDDASGFSDKSVSSARDLVRLGEKVLNEPVLAEIVKQSDATLPVAGLVHNVNSLLGQDGIIGIKTGNTDQAGGCFLFAVQPKEADRPVIIGAFLGLADLPAALRATTSFIETSAGNFAPITIKPAGEAVATINVPWGKPISVTTKSAAKIVSPTGDQITTSVDIPDLKSPTAAKAIVGSLKVKSGSATSDTPLVLSAELSQPPLIWKVLHPLVEIHAISQYFRKR